MGSRVELAGIVKSAMDSSPCTRKEAAIAAALLIPLSILVYYFLRRKISGQRRPPLVPELKGARPLFGHLHLLGVPKPAHVILGELADHHGPIFTIRLGVRRTLIVSNWEIAKECFTTNDRVFANRPKMLAGEIMGYNYAMFGFSPYGPYWREMRKITTLEVLSNQRLSTLRHVRESEMRMATRELYEKWVKNEVVEMKEWFGKTNLNTVFKMVIGKRYAEAEASNRRSREALRELFVLTGAFPMADAVPFLRWLDIGGHERAMKRTAKDLDVVMQQWLKEHKQKTSSGEKRKGDQEDFMDMMLSVVGDAVELPSYDADTIIKATCLAVIMGGTDTTTVSLTWTLALLLNHRNILERAQQELDTNVGQQRRVREDDLNHLPLLQAIIKESLRLYPSAPLSVPHESTDGCTTAGYFIPARTRLIVNISKTQRDPNVWENPDEFLPERFLTTHKHYDVRGHNFELIPFGSGRRVCPGISFALQVLQLTLANLLHAFDIRTVSDQVVDMTGEPGITNLKATPLQVILTPRLSSHLYELET